MTCKDCKYFVQGTGHSGTCEKKPYVSNRNGTPQIVQGKPRKLVIYWAHNICKLFEKGADCSKGERVDES